MANNIDELRKQLFSTIERLNSKEENGMTVEMAKAVAAIGQVIINSAKLEIDFIKAHNNSNALLPIPEFITPEPKKLVGSK